MKEKIIRYLANRAARRLLLAAIMFDLEYITAKLEVKNNTYELSLKKLNEEVLAEKEKQIVGNRLDCGNSQGC